MYLGSTSNDPSGAASMECTTSPEGALTCALARIVNGGVGVHGELARAGAL